MLIGRNDGLIGFVKGSSFLYRVAQGLFAMGCLELTGFARCLQGCIDALFVLGMQCLHSS